MSAMLALAGCQVEQHAVEVETAVASTPVPALLPTAEPTANTTPVSSPTASPVLAFATVEQTLLARYASASPTKWGERVPGVQTRLQTKNKVIALTFDACGGKDGSGYDEKLIQYLIQEQIPATLFINARWMAANPSTFQSLAANPLFEIENHGTEHRPLSVTGKPAYGIAGTKSVKEVIHEMNDNADQIEKLTGKRPLFFRSGTAFYDEIAVAVAHDLGFAIAGYSVLGDAGATYNTEQVYNAISKATSGSIVLAHMNHPEKDTAEGVIKAIPVLQQAGFHFVQLASMELND
ncbi:polysaccharide deacetylase family protein [Paenibacillus qinlingensis]|nr:polysaccharide deacetylase family protein [Paenibacillus qinlingensis]